MNKIENCVQGLKFLVEEAKLQLRKAPDIGDVITDKMKKQISEIKASFLSVIDEVDNVFSNDAVNLLMTNIEYISGTIKEIENVLQHEQNTIDRDALEKFLESLSEQKDKY